MFTKHEFNPPKIAEDMIIDKTTYLKAGAVINCYAIQCVNQHEVDTVAEYCKMSMGSMSGTYPMYFGTWIHAGEIRRIRTSSDLHNHTQLNKSGTPIVNFNEFMLLKDQEEFDVLEFISNLG